MENVLNIASYIASRYKKETGEVIDEMKLHKLLYFAQREALVLNLGPMFDEPFEAWKYGPVMISVRDWYKEGMPEKRISDSSLNRFKAALDYVFENYSRKESWYLSQLSHGEECWRNAEKNKVPGQICVEDMKEDVEFLQNRYKLWDEFYGEK